MRRCFAVFVLVAACSDNHLPGFATGEPPRGYDASVDRQIDASVADAGDAGDAAPDAR